MRIDSWEKKYYPTYFFNEEELPKGGVKIVDETTEKAVCDIDIGGKKATSSLTLYRKGDLKGLFTVQFGAMDHWFEEDEEVFVHPKDPYKVFTIILVNLAFLLMHRISGLTYCNQRGMYA
jgi:hypothetical protein